MSEESLGKPQPVSDQAPATYWLTRFVLLRWLGLVYAVAFLCALNQNVPLLGLHGLTPADLYLQRVEQQFGSRWEGFVHVPSLFWLGLSDTLLNEVAAVGLGLSLVVLAGFANSLLMALLWALYMSIVHIGQTWYSFGWEIQLLETGFLAIFLCPLLDARPIPSTPPPIQIIWLFRWLGFRIMLGSGLIKMRGDSCWRDLSCLDYHFETQPNPNPISRYLHFMPRTVLHFGVFWNHLVELVAPWFSFGPRAFRHTAGAIMISFQLFLIVSGNLSFLNWLTIVPMLSCFDDALLGRVLPQALTRRAAAAALEASATRGQIAVSWAVFALVAVLSVAPVGNLISDSQMMNTSFESLDLVNSYGAFGSVGRQRDEIILEGTRDATLTAATEWREYDFKCKPGDPYRRPCIITPYHYRLDWLMWFAAMSSPEEYPWTLHLVWKLLHNDAGALSLLAGNPFPGSPPRYIRAVLYHYQFTPPGDPSGRWWNRTPSGDWLPALSAHDPKFRAALSQFGWIPGGPLHPLSPDP